MDTVRPKSRPFVTVESSEMSAVATLTASARSLVRREQNRVGVCAETAIRRVADRIKIGHGTFANIARAKVKSVCISIGNRIIAAAISDIENERKQLEHERAILMELGPLPNRDDVAAVDACLEAAREILARMKGAAR